MEARWRKVLADLWGNKTRTLLTVLTIAVGVFAMGLVRSVAVITLDRYVRRLPGRQRPPGRHLHPALRRCHGALGGSACRE